MALKSKGEILNQLYVQGKTTNGNKNDLIWQEAFDLYKKQTGDVDVNMECGGCYRKILEWLRK